MRDVDHGRPGLGLLTAGTDDGAEFPGDGAVERGEHACVFLGLDGFDLCRRWVCVVIGGGVGRTVSDMWSVVRCAVRCYTVDPVLYVAGSDRISHQDMHVPDRRVCGPRLGATGHVQRGGARTARMDNGWSHRTGILQGAVDVNRSTSHSLERFISRVFPDAMTCCPLSDMHKSVHSSVGRDRSYFG